jgi:hypothetical protein
VAEFFPMVRAKKNQPTMIKAMPVLFLRGSPS